MSDTIIANHPTTFLGDEPYIEEPNHNIDGMMAVAKDVLKEILKTIVFQDARLERPDRLHHHALQGTYSALSSIHALTESALRNLDNV